MPKSYTSQSAKDAQRTGYGDQRYWDYLEAHAIELRDKLLAKGEMVRAQEMMTRSLGEALMGNEGV